jgi:hypothetical protein
MHGSRLKDQLAAKAVVSSAAVQQHQFLSFPLAHNKYTRNVHSTKTKFPLDPNQYHVVI